MVDANPNTTTDEQPATADTVQQEEEDIVTAFDIKAASDTGINYNKLIQNYGCFDITQAQLDKIELLTGKKAHRFLRRQIFFCQRDLDEIIKAYEQKKPFYLYTGRGPSTDAMHMGHCIPMMFTQYL